MKYLVRNLFPTLKELSVVSLLYISGGVLNYLTKLSLNFVRAPLRTSVASTTVDVIKYQTRVVCGCPLHSSGL